MREFDLLDIYPNLNKRYFSKNFRTIKNRIISSYKGKEFYDGKRNNGYGGYKNDGRWSLIAKKIFQIYKLKNNAKILQIGCDKGFLLSEIKKLFPKSKVNGIENSRYAISKSPINIRKNIIYGDFDKLNFPNKSFDFVIAIGPVYSLNLSGSIKCLKEIARVGKGKSFITLGSYENERQFKLLRYWTLLGTTLLSKKEWKIVLKHCNYRGDYKFNTAKNLNLKLL
jgi:hypothetical protein